MSFPDLPELQDDLGRDTVLCALSDIADPGGRGFRIRGRNPIFVIRKDGALYVAETVNQRIQKFVKK